MKTHANKISVGWPASWLAGMSSRIHARLGEQGKPPNERLAFSAPDVEAVVAGEWGMRGGRNGSGVCAVVRESGHELGWRACIAGRAHGATGPFSPGALPNIEG